MQVRALQVGDVPPDIKGRTRADTEGKEGSGTVYTSSFFIGLLVQPKPGEPIFFVLARGVPQQSLMFLMVPSWTYRSPQT